jgi:hypothetical protein
MGKREQMPIFLRNSKHSGQGSQSSETTVSARGHNLEGMGIRVLVNIAVTEEAHCVR